MTANRVRIIGGVWRSRVLRFPAVPDLRPSPDRVRETLFNWLGQDLTGWACLDLFAGSGALGFEAASRGASRVVMVDRARPAVAALRGNAGLLRATQVEVVQDDALEFLRHDLRRYDAVFLDPPFSENLLCSLLPLVTPRLAPEGRVYVESGAAVDATPPWTVLRRGRMGRVHYQLLALEAPWITR